MRANILIRDFFSNQSGATALEYGLIVGLVAVTILSAVQIIGGGIDDALVVLAETIRDSI